MLNIPFERNRGKACALSCYTMTARYFFPDMTFEQISDISDWKPGYVVWGFKFWLWIMDKGIKIVNFDSIDLESWANDGVDGLRRSMSKEEYEFIKENTYNLKSYSADIKKVLDHSNFTFNKRNPNWSDLQSAFNDNAVCEVVLNSEVLDGGEGFAWHRVEILAIDEKNITFHDPRTNKSMPHRVESVDLFKKAWIDSLDSSELCIYKK